MHWINIHTETLRGEEFLGAEPLERATWLSLLGWCCAQENSGTITGCGDWSSRKWQQICGVTLEEVNTTSQLYEFDGSNLIVHFYPLEHQEKAEASRVNGKKGGRPKKTTPTETLTQQGNKPIGSILVNPGLNLEETQSEPRANLNSNSNSNCNFKSNSNTSSPLSQSDDQKLLKAVWSIFPEVGRRRSSKKQVATEWKKIKKTDRPTQEAIVESLKGWIACPEWQRDNCQAVQGVHLWIKNERWNNTPTHYIAPSRDLTKPTMS